MGFPGRESVKMQSHILYLMGATFPKECSRRLSGHLQDQWFFTEESIAFTAVLSPSFKTAFSFRSINKMRCQQRIVRKYSSGLHRIATKGLLSLNLDRSKNLRSVSLSVTFKLLSTPMQNKRAATLIYNQSYR